MVKSTPTWPSSRIAAAMSAPTSASVRPTRSQSAMRACTRSMAAPASASSSISAADLTMRSRSTTGLASSRVEPGSARWMPRACSAHVRPPTATRDGAVPRRAVAVGGEEGEGVVGLVPGEQLQPEGAGRAGVDHRRLEPRDDEERLALPRDGERGEPLHGVRVVAGEVAQVRAGGEHEQVDAGVRGDLAGGVHPVDGHERPARASSSEKSLVPTGAE